MRLLFMDESFLEPVPEVGPRTKLAAITAVLVSNKQYPEARSQFYHLFSPPRDVGNTRLILPPPELHGSRLLPEEDDQAKLRTYAGVADLVVGLGLKVFRVGVYLTPEVKKTLKGFNDRGALSLCWLNLLFALQPTLEEGVVISVMDLADRGTQDHFSQTIRNIDHMRESGPGGSLSVSNTENIFGEVFFAESKFAIFIQIADVVGYLLLQQQKDELGQSLTEFKKRLLPIAATLDPAIHVNHTTTLNESK